MVWAQRVSRNFVGTYQIQVEHNRTLPSPYRRGAGEKIYRAVSDQVVDLANGHDDVLSDEDEEETAGQSLLRRSPTGAY